MFFNFIVAWTDENNLMPKISRITVHVCIQFNVLMMLIFFFFEPVGGGGIYYLGAKGSEFCLFGCVRFNWTHAFVY